MAQQRDAENRHPVRQDAQQGASMESWYETVRRYTIRLVTIRGVSPDRAENDVARAILGMLTEDGYEDAYSGVGMDAVEGDAYERHNVYAFLQGASSRTVVLLGHYDTVDTQDYGPLEAWALDPEGLAQRLDALVEVVPGLRADLEAYPGDWMFGRGSIDMKSGVAANIAVTRRLVERARNGTLPVSVVMLATPDEENESAGVLQAARFLSRLRQQYGLDYVGAINTDYTTALYPDDPHRYINSGTIGKLLPSFLIVGKESHVGEPFQGVDANVLAAELIREVSMNVDLCDVVRAEDGNGLTQVAPPPVTLRASDLKAHYDVQLPFAAYFYLNVLTFTTMPGDLLERLRHSADKAMRAVLERLDEAERRWNRMKYGDEAAQHAVQRRSGRVYTYQELYAEAERRVGLATVRREMDEEWTRWPAEMDKRERCLRLTHHLWTLSGSQGPAVVLYFSPPYYPHVAPTGGALHEAIAAVVAAHPQLNLTQQAHYPFISDMSYLRLDPGADLTALKENMPVWQNEDALARPGGYSLPFAAMQDLGLPIVNFGPYGRAAHQRGERVLMSYSFDVLPQLLYETIEHL